MQAHQTPSRDPGPHRAAATGRETAIGRCTWAIAEGYIPSYGNGLPPQLISHEAACLLNAGSRDAHVEITVYFADGEPYGPYRVTVPARRTLHLRFNDLEPSIPRDTDYASVLVSDVPIVVQHTRLDSRRPRRRCSARSPTPNRRRGGARQPRRAAPAACRSTRGRISSA